MDVTDEVTVPYSDPDATSNAAGADAEGEIAGTSAVDTALRRLEDIAGLPLERRPDAFHAIHEHLRSALTQIDDT